MKISLLLPYWNRQEAANKALESLKIYKDIDLEIIVVDDGSEIPFHPLDGLPIKVIRLPRKDEPRSPVTCWNVAAKAATGEVLVISCVEVIHETPILAELTANVGKDDYVMASAWCPEEDRWHTHSTVIVPDCPPEAGLGFCAALRPELYWRAGGWDEAYREGAGYEDRDWIRRLHFVGAKFIKRDDLKVIHPKSGASIAWGQEKFERNLALFRLKWPETPPVTFVCLNAGNYCGRGAEYVNNLADMVKRNMPYGVRWRFVCLTDDPTGLNDGIDVLPLPPDLKGWWGKLYLFKRGLFEDGTRMVFFDLDTLILNSLEKIIQYQGDMAILRDFYQPNRGAPGVILWKAGCHTCIWDEWEAEGRPENQLGDLGWIEGLDQGRFTKKLDRLQDLFPESFVSFKAHCHPYPPKGAAVVCFHGLPRPHQCDGWVQKIWKVGGGKTPELAREINTHSNVIVDNVKLSCARNLQWLDIQVAHKGIAVIVGGGPSLKHDIEKIRALQDSTIIALNGTAKFLLDHGIKPDWQIILDARKENREFVTEVDRYFIASTCDAGVFDALNGKSVVLYHPHMIGIENHIPNGKPLHLIGGGSTVGMLSMTIAYTQGYRDIRLFGFDSSYSEGQHHAYEQTLNDGEVCVDVICGGRNFKCAAWMVTQAQEFQETALALAELGCEIKVHGTGLLPYVAWQMSIQEAA